MRHCYLQGPLFGKGEGFYGICNNISSAAEATIEMQLAELKQRTRARDVAAQEGLWDGKCKTLYVVEIERLAAPFPMTALVKRADNQPIDPSYIRSYCLVHAHRLSR